MYTYIMQALLISSKDTSRKFSIFIFTSSTVKPNSVQSMQSLECLKQSWVSTINLHLPKSCFPSVKQCSIVYIVTKSGEDLVEVLNS